LAVAADPDPARADRATAGSPFVRLDVWLNDPIAGVLVLGDGRLRHFVGWLGLMSALEWGRESPSAGGNQS
jgi:hypothetical protein